MKGAILRYRIMAYVVGVGLVILVCIGVPLKYAANFDPVVAVVGPMHGFLYIVYLLTVLDLAARRRWHLVKIILVMAAGTIPFLSFVAEHLVVKEIRAKDAQKQAAAAAAPRPSTS